MIKYFILFLAIISFNNIGAQDYLKVLGRKKYTLKADITRLKISFSDNAESISQKSKLIQNLDTENLNITIDTSTQNLVIIDIHKIDDFFKIKTICNNQNIYPSTYYIFQNENNEYQDNLAVHAIKNATSQASLLAKVMNKKIDRIVNIDDVVEKYLFYTEEYPESECMKKILVWYNEYISVPEDPGKTEFDTNSKTGLYAIWVTYKLK